MMYACMKQRTKVEGRERRAEGDREECEGGLRCGKPKVNEMNAELHTKSYEFANPDPPKPPHLFFNRTDILHAPCLT